MAFRPPIPPLGCLFSFFLFSVLPPLLGLSVFFLYLFSFLFCFFPAFSFFLRLSLSCYPPRPRRGVVERRASQATKTSTPLLLLLLLLPLGYWGPGNSIVPASSRKMMNRAPPGGKRPDLARVATLARACTAPAASAARCPPRSRGGSAGRTPPSADTSASNPVRRVK